MQNSAESAEMRVLPGLVDRFVLDNDQSRVRVPTRLVDRGIGIVDGREGSGGGTARANRWGFTRKFTSTPNLVA